MYDLLFGGISSTFEEYEVEAKVTQVVLDFETAAATSVRSVFLQIRIIFCFFSLYTMFMAKIATEWITGRVF